MSNRSDGEGEAMIRLFASAAMAATLPLTAVAQTTPGQINDPSTYHGSMANQAQEQASAAAQAAANQQCCNALDQDYAAYAPQGGGRALGGGGAPPVKQLPLLHASKNPLIGKWQMGATKPVDLNGLEALPETQSIVNGAFAGGCESIFGKGRIAFTPSQLNWVAPDGHEEILNRACAQNQPSCSAGMKAMTASSVGLLTMDSTGRAQTPSLPSGQYFILGFAPYNGKPLVWHRPYFLRPGANSVVLDQTNANAPSDL